MKTLIPTLSSASLGLALPLLLTFAAAPSLRSQDAAGPDDSGVAPAVRGPQVAVVGASVSEGFSLADYADRVKNPRAMVAGYLFRKIGDAEFTARMRSFGLTELIAAGYPAEPKVLGATSEWLFQSPEGTAKRQLKVALEGEAEVVYAVDLPFWFGYGGTGVSSRAENAGPLKREARLAEQEELFTLIRERFDDTDRQLILGDYPDVTGARIVINPPWIPKRPVQKELNERLHAFAAERPNVHVFPLKDLVKAVRGKGVKDELGGEEILIDREVGMQFDLVHTTALGNAALARRVLLFARERLPEVLRPAEVSLDDLFQRTGVTEPWLGREAAGGK